MSLDGTNGRRNLSTLLRDLAEGSVALVREEVRLAKIEMSQAATAIGRGTMFAVAGATLALLGTLSLVIALALLVGDQWLAADRYWLAALLVMVVATIVAAWFAKRGLALLSPAQLAPKETVSTLKEDTEWLKRRLT
jgi:uncharacterized membrane protein YqjE